MRWVYSLIQILYLHHTYEILLHSGKLKKQPAFEKIGEESFTHAEKDYIHYSILHNVLVNEVI